MRRGHPWGECVPQQRFYLEAQSLEGRLLESRHPCNEGISILGSFFTDVKGGRDEVHGMEGMPGTACFR